MESMGKVVLRENLARRLHHVFWTGGDTPVPEFVYGDVTDSDRRLADECIRQMEWARSQVMVELADESNQPIDFTKGHTDAVCPLTPAPDDWKPE